MTIMANEQAGLQHNKIHVEDDEACTSDGADDEISDNSANANEDEEQNGVVNAGWADLVSKILKTNKPKRKKTIVLSKARKLTDVRKVKPKPAGFEVQTVDGVIKDEKINVEEIDRLHGETPHKKKRELVTNLRVKPNILERDRERTIQKIATKGVVQLFNAVKMQQKDINDKLKAAGPLEVRKEKVLKNIDKRAFLDVLMGEKSQKIVSDVIVNQSQATNSSKESTWSVLKDDFMMTAKMKDWDKALEDEEQNEDEQQNIESD